jgi:hypothetical protein
LNRPVNFLICNNVEIDGGYFGLLVAVVYLIYFQQMRLRCRIPRWEQEFDGDGF